MCVLCWGVVVKHWEEFRPFYTKFFEIVNTSTNSNDQECSASLSNVRFMLDEEFTRGAEPLRAVALYRMLLQVIMDHQATFMLSNVDVGAKALHNELGSMEVVVKERHLSYTYLNPNTIIPTIDAKTQRLIRKVA